MKQDIFKYIKNGSRHLVSWMHSGVEVTIDCTDDTAAFMSKDQQHIVVENWKDKKLEIYSARGDKLGAISIESNMFSYRGLNYCHTSSSGISIIVIPKDGLFDNPHDDLIQLDVDVKNMKIGKKVAIYR
ncbi:hypothetical protein [Aeromonas bivalvium]|uniref:hypothetical protein n=1 Tax=Aeromonas bivalvium TaxID=440079 RepID=UPI0012FC4355|nr:hypothetical protein [Aeromonas bivalvium]